MWCNSVDEVAQDRPGGVVHRAPSLVINRGVVVVGSFPDTLLPQVPNVALHKITVVCMFTRYLDNHFGGIINDSSRSAAQSLFFGAKVVGFVLSTLAQVVEHA